MVKKQLKTYEFFGVLRGAYPIDLNGVNIHAYSTKQAKLKLAFKLREKSGIKGKVLFQSFAIKIFF